MLNNVTFLRISEYARVTGKPVSAVLNAAVNEWMDQTGDLVVIELEERRKRKRKPAKILRMGQ
jgi:hypothetical protein